MQTSPAIDLELTVQRFVQEAFVQTLGKLSANGSTQKLQ